MMGASFTGDATRESPGASDDGLLSVRGCAHEKAWECLMKGGFRTGDSCNRKPGSVS